VRGATWSCMRGSSIKSDRRDAFHHHSSHHPGCPSLTTPPIILGLFSGSSDTAASTRARRPGPGSSPVPKPHRAKPVCEWRRGEGGSSQSTARVRRHQFRILYLNNQDVRASEFDFSCILGSPPTVPRPPTCDLFPLGRLFCATLPLGRAASARNRRQGQTGRGQRRAAGAVTRGVMRKACIKPLRFRGDTRHWMGVRLRGGERFGHFLEMTGGLVLERLNESLYRRPVGLLQLSGRRTPLSSSDLPLKGSE